MFNLGWGELVLIGIVALIAIGPKELPTVLRTLGQTMAKIRRMASEFQGQFNDALREAELHDLKQQAEEMTSSFTSFDPMADVQKDIQGAIESDPVKTDTSEPEPAKADDAPHDDAAQAAPPLPPIDVPPAELPAPASEKDFAETEKPEPKQAGSGG
ncbi:MAG: Sec-independent protein translocase protein TatB [Bradyrhizobium sp.]